MVNSGLDLGKYGDWEIGTVYKSKKTNKYFVAVTNEKLVTYDRGRFQVFTTGDKHIARPNLSFKQLTKIWKISPSAIDDYMAKWLAPDEETKRLKKEKLEKRWMTLASGGEEASEEGDNPTTDIEVDESESPIELVIDE